MTATMFDSKRIVRTYRQTIDAPPARVFPLLCPVRESEWLEGWKSTMLYSASGLIEEGAVFTTSSGDDADTVWIVTRHDKATGEIEFARVTPGSRTCVLKIVVLPCGADRTHVDVTYTYTSIAPQGNAFLDKWTSQVFLEEVIFWEKSMNHFLKTGGRLPRAAPEASSA